MDGLIAAAACWPGVGFRPTEEELVNQYLKRMLRGEEFNHELIPKRNVYDYTPWELAAYYPLTASHGSSYFFSTRKRATPTTYNRAAKEGSWEQEGRVYPIKDGNNIIAVKKTYHFLKGAGAGDRRSAIDTPWLMVEYSLDNVAAEDVPPNLKDSLTICKIYNKDLKQVAARGVLEAGQQNPLLGPGSSSAVAGATDEGEATPAKKARKF